MMYVYFLSLATYCVDNMSTFFIECWEDSVCKQSSPFPFKSWQRNYKSSSKFLSCIHKLSIAPEVVNNLSLANRRNGLNMYTSVLVHNGNL